MKQRSTIGRVQEEGRCVSVPSIGCRMSSPPRLCQVGHVARVHAVAWSGKLHRQHTAMDTQSLLLCLTVAEGIVALECRRRAAPRPYASVTPSRLPENVPKPSSRRFHRLQNERFAPFRQSARRESRCKRR